MSFRSALNEWLSILLKIGVIAVIVVGFLWGALSVWGNVIEGREAMDNAPKGDLFTIKNTGERIVSSDYETDGSRYILSSYYEYQDDKWKLHETTVVLDEKYFGKIDFRRR